MDNKNKAEALLEFLKFCHADDYVGLDDDMPDHFNDWISDLTEDKVSKLVLSTLRKGI